MTTPRHAALIVLTIATAATAFAVPPVPEPTVRLIETDPTMLALPGTTRPHRLVTLGAAFDGELETLPIREGEFVRKGDLIAKLDDAVASAAYELAKEEASQTARVQRAQAQLDRVERILSRTEEMHDRHGANAEELAEARTSVALAKAELAEAEESVRASAFRVDEARARVEQHALRAPFDGVVLRRLTDEGAVLRTGDPIVEFAAIDRMRVDLYLPASVALGVNDGDAYALELDAPVGRVVWARATYVEPRIDPTSNTVRVVFDFETPDGLIPAGLLVTPADRVPNKGELAYMRGESMSGSLATVDESDER